MNDNSNDVITSVEIENFFTFAISRVYTFALLKDKLFYF